MPDQLLTTPQVAERLGVAQITLLTWRRNATGPTYLKVGKAVRYRESDLVAWLATREVKPS